MIIVANNQGILKLPVKIDHKILFCTKIPTESISNVVFDFEKTKTITISGVLYLLCLIGYLNEKRKEITDLPINSEIINIDNSLIKFLMNFYYFNQMVIIGNLKKVNKIDLLDDSSFLDFEKKFTKYQLNKPATIENSNKYLMPITIIPIGGKELFETTVGKFRDRFNYFYKSLILIEYFKIKFENNGEIQKLFMEFNITINEIIKNIYDHCQSVGFGAIHARENGIEMVFYDYGIGIEKSMKQNTIYNSLNELEVIKLALEDGVSSKSENGENRGRGFTKMLEFAEQNNGFLSIRTGKYHYINKKLISTEWFPGTQIVVYIPKC
ncbi:MAG: hypothetical protein LCH54_02950 [Bacteroidetes bacterium]|nr:hypothetical protein [Bacteroidota bacterium]